MSSHKKLKRRPQPIIDEEDALLEDELEEDEPEEDEDAPEEDEPVEEASGEAEGEEKEPAEKPEPSVVKSKDALRLKHYTIYQISFKKDGKSYELTPVSVAPVSTNAQEVLDWLDEFEDALAEGDYVLGMIRHVFELKTVETKRRTFRNCVALPPE